ncbi:Terminase small subunit (plasmid) [Roseivivax sp. THAF40]|uniref:terminase small subunit n=1 Tax=Roseivivax sp. THAF40 TaxID=2587858 RepID=UPI001267A0C4|nr:terminase small subunit [Roseivivax sp. THAF40]QFT48721.1 Terminase small subunit [Roseivivax sp. THAF40]
MNMISNELIGLDVPLWALQFDLTTQQTAFVESYIEHFDPDHAAREAGVKARDISKVAHRLLKMRKIQQAIKYRVTDLRDRCEAERDRLLNHIWAILNADIKDLFDDNRKPKPIQDWPASFPTAALKRYELRSLSRPPHGYVLSITMADRLKLLELLMTHLGMLDPHKKKKKDEKLIEKARAHRAREERLAHPRR